MRRLLIPLLAALLCGSFIADGTTTSLGRVSFVVSLLGVVGYQCAAVHYQFRPGRWYWQVRAC